MDPRGVGGPCGVPRVAQPTEGNDTALTSRWIITIGLMLIGFLVCMAIGSRLGDTGKAALFGVATGIINALYVVTAKVPSVDPLPAAVDPDRPGRLQRSGRRGLRHHRLPVRTGDRVPAAMIAVNPLIATVAAMYLFDVTINDSPIDLIVIAIAVVGVLIGIVKLSTSEAVHGSAEDSDPRTRSPSHRHRYRVGPATRVITPTIRAPASPASHRDRGA